MKNFALSEETLGYQTSTDPSNSDQRLLIAGSKNVLIDNQRKVKSRPGYTRLGAANTALTGTRNAWTWETSTGFKAPQRFYDDELEIYLGTIDTVEINAWTRVKDGWSTTQRLRHVEWFDATEKIDLQIMVQGDDNIYEWNGAVAVVDSITSVTVTKKGTTTFGQNRFYANRDRTFVCVRTGTEYTYTGGAGTTTLTGIADTAGLIAGDILIQKVVTKTDKPNANRNNHTIGIFQNQVIIGSNDDEEAYISKNSSYYDFSFSSPRAAGEGVLLTLTDPMRAAASVGKSLVVWAGRSNRFKIEFSQLAIGSSLTETVKVTPLDTGEDQGILCQESLVSIGNSVAYLTNEVAVRVMNSPDDLQGIDPITFSNPIKPDFDSETWYNGTTPEAFGIWYKNTLIYTAPQGSRMYMLNFMETADGKVQRFWNPPQILPVGPLSVIDLNDGKGAQLYGHSNNVPETYLLFDGLSDGQYADMPVEDKLPIEATAVFVYNNYGKRGALKTFDEYFVEGEITTNTSDLMLTLNYDFEGSTQTIERTIDGSDQDILEGFVGLHSLAQSSLANNPLGGLLNPPSDARKFRVIFEMTREDFFEISAALSTNEVDRYWAILAHGANVELSRRRPINIRK